jgi:outer membrane murein-binding lipoprotein Lpp
VVIYAIIFICIVVSIIIGKRILTGAINGRGIRDNNDGVGRLENTVDRATKNNREIESRVDGIKKSVEDIEGNNRSAIDNIDRAQEILRNAKKRSDNK